MKKLLLSTVCAVSMFTCSACGIKNWDKKDQQLFGAVAVLQTIDCIQTDQIVENDDELNPLIYKKSVVVPYFIGTTYLYYLIADNFPKYRTPFLKGVTGIQIINTGRNWSLGYKIPF